MIWEIGQNSVAGDPKAEGKRISCVVFIQKLEKMGFEASLLLVLPAFLGRNISLAWINSHFLSVCSLVMVVITSRVV